jgi:hypothetical protein
VPGCSTGATCETSSTVSAPQSVKVTYTFGVSPPPLPHGDCTETYWPSGSLTATCAVTGSALDGRGEVTSSSRSPAFTAV